MTLKKAIEHIRNTNLPNVTNFKQMSDEQIVESINEGLTMLHTLFLIRKEQAIIRISGERNTFVLVQNDPDVVLSSFHKTSFKLLSKSLSHPLPDNTEFDELRKLDTTSTSTSFMNKSVVKPNNEVLQILYVEDSKNTEYLMNEKNVFLISQNTLYFPNLKNINYIYVIYKPKPITYTSKDLNLELDLPDGLLECLYSFVTMKVSSGIEGLKEFHNVALNDYSLKIKEAMYVGTIVQDSLEGVTTQRKGFI